MGRQETHYPCKEQGCLSYTAYIRIKQKWIPVGVYNTKCQVFIPSVDRKMVTKSTEPIVKSSLDQGIRDFMSNL